ncbi:MAG: hypothetical protein A2252_05660 [Elusimicrobia bacterium RIFOXYA2_FULL_39_19]|nr:MAG: hypothetical protein A2252_05660 [Elusimicrobia bacterium RIFOXYA2_FULL_39_19]
MHFLIDENLPHSLTKLLRKHAYKATNLAEAGLRGRADIDLWKLAHEKKQILVTRDLDFPLPLSKIAPAGLILIRVPDTYNKNDICSLFERFLKETRADSLKGNIFVISPNKIRIRKLLF